MPESTPVPPFSRRLPTDVAERIRATTPKPRRRRRLAALVLAASVLGGGISVALPAEPAQAQKVSDPQMCWYKGWFLEGGVWYQGWFLEEC